MSQWLYTVRERFCATTANDWAGCVSFSGFKHVTEVVTLDRMLCCTVVENVLDDDWNHNVHKDFRLDLFLDPDYPITRHPIDAKRHQLLAVLEAPEFGHELLDGFAFCGYDILDAYVGNSTLTNCGPMPDVFSAADVNTLGLLDELQQAREIRDKMRTTQPDDPHLGECEVWAIARRLFNGE